MLVQLVTAGLGVWAEAMVAMVDTRQKRRSRMVRTDDERGILVFSEKAGNGVEQPHS